MIPIVLTIAGSDSSAGAGIQADLKAISANGGYGASVITAITAQNTRGVTAAAEVDLDLIRAQADAVFGDLRVAAVKTGMLASAPVIETVAKALRDHQPPHYVLDPVMISKTGFPLLRPEAVSALSELLLPLATLVTPNVHEAQALTGLEVRDAGPGGGGGPQAGGGGRARRAGQGRAPRGAARRRTSWSRRAGVRVFPGEDVDARAHARHRLHLLGGHRHAARSRPRRWRTRSPARRHTSPRQSAAGLPVGQGIGPTDHFFYLRRPGDCERWVGGPAAPGSRA